MSDREIVIHWPGVLVLILLLAFTSLVTFLFSGSFFAIGVVAAIILGFALARTIYECWR